MQAIITPSSVKVEQIESINEVSIAFEQDTATIRASFENRPLTLNLNGEKVKTTLASFLEAVAYVLDGVNDFGMDEIDNHVSDIECNLVEAREQIERLRGEW